MQSLFGFFIWIFKIQLKYATFYFSLFNLLLMLKMKGNIWMQMSLLTKVMLFIYSLQLSSSQQT